MLRRSAPQTRTCHFCNTLREKAGPGDFQCTSCGSWNLFDQNGKIRSSHPAMYNESLNAESYSKRASPNKNRLPSSFPPSIFCHTCQTNQNLVVNMLSNYLPPSSDPSYSKLLAEYPSYQSSLYARYPPVCATCQPAVDEQIRQKDSMARTSAFGGWLEASNRRNASPGISAEAPGGLSQASRAQIMAWNMRGVLWISTLIWWTYLSIGASIMHPHLPPGPIRFGAWTVLPSIMWQFWDPTWRSVQRSRSQGREARTEGKGIWVRCQGFIWIMRCVLSGLITLELLDIPRSVFMLAVSLETIVNVLALRSLHIIRPPRIRLVASSRPSTTTPEPKNWDDSTLSLQLPTDVPALSALSLSSLSPARPTSIRAVNPIFGVASFGQPPIQPRPSAYEQPDSDAMDWAPASGTLQQMNNDWLRPPTFAPEKPTGLEGLLEKFGIAGDEEREVKLNSDRAVRMGRGAWLGFFVGVGVAVVAAVLVAWPLGWIPTVSVRFRRVGI